MSRLGQKSWLAARVQGDRLSYHTSQTRPAGPMPRGKAMLAKLPAGRLEAYGGRVGGGVEQEF